MSNKDRRKGRGRIPEMKKLPHECDEIIAWACNELHDQKRDQIDIYQDFRTKLETLQREYHGELEFKIPSFSAFNRYSINLATMTRRIEQTSAIAGAIAERFDAEKSDDLTLIAAEAIKTLVFEVLTAAGEHGIDPKGAMQLANALRAATQAQGISTVRKSRVQGEFEEGVKDAVDTIKREAGLTEETAEQIKAQILGIKNERPDK